MKNQILEEENIEENVIASDSTGFSLGQASLYYQMHSGHRYEHWLKGAYFDAKNLNALDIIPPIRRHDKLVDPERKARADLVATARLDGLFGQRWKTETVHSVIKLKFGDTISSRKTQLQNRELIIKALVYNIHR
ncbi:MAG: hypothetical protein HY865_12220 [Chloroflexi bacterium]|nr:hypothetical protein [Chloroflexota bacterium]